LAADRAYLAQNPIRHPDDLANHRFVGYIPDMIFDKELDYLAEISAPSPHLASNSVSVQLNFLRMGAGVGVVHDFALPAAPNLQRILPQTIALTRSFWLIRHASDARTARLSRFASALMRGVRSEMARLEAQVLAQEPEGNS
jgi:DNA-binding transcriptional LysR family regulator